MPEIIIPTDPPYLPTRAPSTAAGPHNLTPVRAVQVRRLEQAAQHYAGRRRLCHPCCVLPYGSSRRLNLNANPTILLEPNAHSIETECILWCYVAGKILTTYGPTYEETTFDCTATFTGPLGSTTKTWTQGPSLTRVDAVVQLKASTTPNAMPADYSLSIELDCAVEGPHVVSWGMISLPLSRVEV